MLLKKIWAVFVIRSSLAYKDYVWENSDEVNPAQDNGTGLALVGKSVRRALHKGRITSYNHSSKLYKVSIRFLPVSYPRLNTHYFHCFLDVIFQN
jgi:hypothetical protein